VSIQWVRSTVVRDRLTQGQSFAKPDEYPGENIIDRSIITPEPHGAGPTCKGLLRVHSSINGRVARVLGNLGKER
jgi:hypothetical protein